MPNEILSGKKYFKKYNTRSINQYFFLTNICPTKKTNTNLSCTTFIYKRLFT